jgi:putative ABC transport system ATP-binding protein
MLATTDLTFRYPTRGSDLGFALNVPAFALERGQTMALVGPSGCGKSTLLSLLCGERVPDQGSIRFGDQTISRLSDSERRRFRITSVGLVFQEFRLVEYLSALENILLPCRLHPALPLDRTMRTRARALADRLGIGALLERLPERLSQGERQRVAVARALLARPPLILADEPTGSLDPAGKQRLVHQFIDLAREEGAIVIVATHDHALLPSFGRTLDFSAMTSAGGAT